VAPGAQVCGSERSGIFRFNAQAAQNVELVPARTSQLQTPWAALAQ